MSGAGQTSIPDCPDAPSPLRVKLVLLCSVRGFVSQAPPPGPLGTDLVTGAASDEACRMGSSYARFSSSGMKRSPRMDVGNRRHQAHDGR